MEQEGMSFSSLADAYGAQETPQEQPQEQSQEQPQEQEQQQGEQQNGLDYKRIERVMMKERELLELQNRLKQQQEEVGSAGEEFQRYKKAKELAKHDPMAVLEELGINFEDIQNHYSSDNAPTSRREAELRKEIEDLKNRLDEDINGRKKKEEEYNKQEQERRKQYQVEQENKFMREYADKELDENGLPKYELLKEEGAWDLVRKTAKEHFEKTGQKMNYKDAMNKVEETLEQAMQRVLKYKKFGKYGRLLSEENSDSFFNQKPQESFQRHNPTTINGSFASSPPPARDRILDRSESLKRAADMITFND